MSGTSTLEVQTNTSADNAKTDAFCENANVLAQQIEKKLNEVASNKQSGESVDDSITMADYFPLLVAANETKVENVSSVANNVSVREQLKESENETIALVDHIKVQQHRS
ncbi:hypothetical protein OIU85_001156 [Salix viminalis]|uniref:Uncharacterized protein n=1 Tax=Salix viminalis TaxID=40686 RepID=A0A9Q0VL34_SALVM|nr:hypothetical protein OIU85_001156 [Salix viminalis]